MKFLVINHEYPPIGGGAATASFEIAKNLSRLGNEVTVLTSGNRQLPGFCMEQDLAVHRIPCLRRRQDRSGLFEMFSFLVVAICYLPRVLSKHQPDGLIAFFTLPSGLVALVTNLISKTPYVVSLRGGDVPGLVPELNRIHKLLGPVRRSVLRRATAILANSEGLRQLSGKSDQFPVGVIPNGVDADFFRPGSAIESDRLRILFVGRLQKQKNLSLLLEHLARLTPGTFELHVAGDGPEKNDLRVLARELDISGAIVWHDWLSRTQLLPIYQSVDCLVNPSLYEGMPNVVLEAMACGLPVIASNIPGNNEVVVSNETGLLFDLDEPFELADALNRIRDSDLRRRLGANARARVVNRHSWRAVSEEYARLVSGPRAPEQEE